MSFDGATVVPVGRAPPLLRDRRFLALWVGSGLGHTAYNALLFTMLIVVLEATGSSTQTSLLIITLVMPTLVLGPLVAALMDRWAKGKVVLAANVLRAVTCVLLALGYRHVWALYPLALFFSTGNLLFNPAVMALIPSVVTKEQLVSANSLYNFTIIGSQLVGLVFLAPTVLKLGGSVGREAMFLVGSGMFAASAFWFSPLMRLGGGGGNGRLRAIPGELRQALGLLARDRPSAVALAQLTVGNALVLLFVTLMPKYMKDVLHISPSNAAFVFAPTGVGALVGLRVLPWAARRFGKERLVPAGMVGIALCLVLLAMVEPLAAFMRRASGPLNPEKLLGLSLLQSLTMVFAGPLGLSYAFLNAPAQTVLHERAPSHMRGRIFTTQAMVAQSLSLAPVIFMGALTDLLDALAGPPGIVLVLGLIAAVMMAMAAVNWRLVRGHHGKPWAS
jgi:MFS family permease